jgi:hypothetical protein
MAKRPKLPSWDELRADVNPQRVSKGLAPMMGDEPERVNDQTAPSSSDATVKDDSYRVDPDPKDLFSRTRQPSRMQITHTSTTNPQRPRTLAAGYDPKNQTMTVVFRDNTWWNYYDVPEDIWEGFRQSESKGKYLRESGLDSWDSMGPANIAGFSDSQKEMLNFVAKRSEQMQGGQEENKNMGSQFNP